MPSMLSWIRVGSMTGASMSHLHSLVRAARRQFRLASDVFVVFGVIVVALAALLEAHAQPQGERRQQGSQRHQVGGNVVSEITAAVHFLLRLYRVSRRTASQTAC